MLSVTVLKPKCPLVLNHAVGTYMSEWVEETSPQWLWTPSCENLRPQAPVPAVEVCSGVVLGKCFLL